MLEHSTASEIAPDRVVVIGAGGFVGSAIVKELQSRGLETLALTRRELDLLADGAGTVLAGMLKPTDSVVFVSAVAPAKSSRQLLVNLQMADAAVSAFASVRPAHLLYVSSDAVYADDANPVTEASAVAPSTIHGMMHAARELMFRTDVQTRFATLRPTLIFGSADPHNGYGPNRFRRQASAGAPIAIFGEGEERRDHVAVEDVARLAARIILRASVGSLNAVTGVSTSFRDVALTVAAQFDPAVVVQSVPRPGPRPHLLHRFFDIAECYRAFPDFRFERLDAGLARVHLETLQAL